jgi:hypothetical protein
MSDSLTPIDLREIITMSVSTGGAPCKESPGGARRVLEQQSAERARGLPQLQRPEQPQQQPGRAAGVFLPHLLPPCYGAGVANRSSARLLRAFPPYRHGQRFRQWPPTKVCGPRRRVLDGAGESRPHGRREPCPSATNRIGAPPGRRPRGASLRFYPPAQEPSEFGHH